MFCSIWEAITRCACRIFDEQMLLIIIIIWLEWNHLKESIRIFWHFLYLFFSFFSSLCLFITLCVFIVLLCYSRTIFGIFLEHKCHYKFDEALRFALLSSLRSFHLSFNYVALAAYRYHYCCKFVVRIVRSIEKLVKQRKRTRRLLFLLRSERKEGKKQTICVSCVCVVVWMR